MTEELPALRPAGVSVETRQGVPVRLMTYDVPLRRDLVVRLTLPVMLTEEDAERMCAYVNALVFHGG